MKILVVGGGGREHALCLSLHKSSLVEEILCAPGNPGIAEVADCLPVAAGDIVELADLAEKLRVDLTVVGPELPLSLGIVDEFAKRQLPVFGPTRLAAQIETSKVFSKEFFRRHQIPTAEAVVCSGIEEARQAIQRFGFPVVLKADGLAGGKGVLIIESAEDAERALPLFFQERVFGAAGDRIVVEEFLRGQEASFLVLYDGVTAVPLPTARDYKKVYDGDRGPNTGGMGAHSPAGVLNAEMASQVLKDILWPTFRGLEAEGRGFSGVLYAGLMVTDSGPKVLEYNARFGDPETEVILPRVTSDVAAVLRAAATGGLAEFLPLGVKNEACVGVVLCAAGYPGNHERGRPITGLAEAARMPGVEVFHAGTARDGDRLVTAGGRVLVVTATAASMTEAAARAYDAADRIHFEGKQLRRDIAAGGIRPSRI
ncbi:MAG TPA: phosphoribosylamine--glycine ligase [Thermoanaerobaculia bacterium]|nr:phosphoribosylamine--glycine ligase [Thermoanaerobaculia bacterium]